MTEPIVECPRCRGERILRGYDGEPRACPRCSGTGLQVVIIPVARCACGACFDAAGWARLALLGVQEDDEERLELRNCPCGSTLSAPLVDVVRRVA